jgi:hypothetical protein
VCWPKGCVRFKLLLHVVALNLEFLTSKVPRAFAACRLLRHCSLLPNLTNVHRKGILSSPSHTNTTSHSICMLLLPLLRAALLC